MKKLIQGWSTAQAELQPEATAVVHEGARCSYGELEARSNRIARALSEAGSKPGDNVAVIAAKSMEALAGMLGILKAGCAYVPLDPHSEPRYAAFVLEQCECGIALVDRSAAELASRLDIEKLLRRPLRLGWLHDGLPDDAGLETAFSADQFRSLPEAFSGPDGDDEDLAHIVFPRHSSGEPKGVMLSHRNVVRHIDWAVNSFDMGPSDRVSGQAPFTSDLATQDIYSAFAAGAELHLVPSGMSVPSRQLAQQIRDSQLTHWFATPPLLADLALRDALEQDDFPLLKRLLWRGEGLSTAALAYWMRKLPHVSFWRLYGPPEATVASSYYQAPRDPSDAPADLPIGSPCDGERMYVLDSALKLLPPGAAGDLYISGAGLSAGYWRDPENTRSAFLPNPFPRDPSRRIYRTGELARLGEDGLFYLVGRPEPEAPAARPFEAV